ncbi:Elongation factor-like GTPase 1 [Linum grandiflorum]
MADPNIHNVRNICILAHVDHGKTTLADHLIAGTGGGHLHPKLAGKLRFMDYLDEEQRRAITMKSSSISLNFRDSHSINLIDSPGHMDFCSEVSTAARLSDGALVLVDAVEGVHIQTHAVLRQAWIEKLTPCLVLNKIDRLIGELELTPMEAYTRLLRIVHEVNVIISGYNSEKYLSDVDSILASQSGELGGDEGIEFLGEDDKEDTFQPQKGNVAFVCALDGWGFTTKEFSEFYAEKFGISSSEKLQTALWGAKYFIPKTKMIVGKKFLEAGDGSSSSNKARPMFVQFVLEPLWQVYQSVSKPGGDKVLEKVIKSFKLNIPQRELQNKDPKLVLQSVMSRWLPLSDSVLSMVVRCMPDPVAAQSFRISRLLPKRDAESNTKEAEVVRKCVEVCDSTPEAPCVAFVSKMFAVSLKMLPRKGPDGQNVDEDGDSDSDSDSGECFLAFARIFSGVMYAGQKIYVLSALYDPSKPDSIHKHLQEAELQSLYLMMGQGLIPVTSVKAGNLVAIRGLGQHILKSATLSSTRNCWPFASMAFQVSPTLRVAIEPSDPADIGALMKGLRLLNRADPFVGVTVSSRGEHVLAAAGEVHLERCIKDLKERFAKVDLEVSPPLVSYRESIEGDGSSNPSDYFEKVTPNGRCVVRVQVMKLPAAITKLLDESAETLVDIFSGKLDENAVKAFRKRLMDAVKYRLKWRKLLKRIWAFGPGQVGPNILFTPDPKTTKNDASSFLVVGSPYVSERLGLLDDPGDESTESTSHPLQNSVVSGFQLATSAGPLCDEPMWGLGFVVEAHVSPLAEQPDESESKLMDQQHGILQGQVMATVKDACRSTVLQKKPRIVEAMYFCELNTRTEHLGSMYAVLNRRRARVLKEEMQEGSPLFTVHAYVPVSESFGFADELRRWTSGGASALLVLSHWEALPEDPFFVPKTEEEIEEFGDGSSVLQNTARKLIDSVRRRKGLPVEEKVVQFGTKQRTRARKV